MKMTKTSLALVAALAATATLGPARADSYLNAREALAHIYGGSGISGEAIANMTDQQCRDYVKLNVRATNSEKTREALRAYQRAKMTIANYKARKADMDASLRTWLFGARADSDGYEGTYQVINAIGALIVVTRSILATVAALPTGPGALIPIAEGVASVQGAVNNAEYMYRESRILRAEVRQSLREIDSYIAKYEAVVDGQLAILDDIEKAVRKAQRKYCDSGVQMSLPTEADITGGSISDYGARVGGPMFTAKDPTKRRDPRCGQALQQIQVNQQYINQIDPRHPQYAAVVEQVRYSTQATRDWYNQHCQ